MGWTRRSLLRSTLLWGMGQAAWGIGLELPWLRRCQLALAAPTQRKLALLVGINHYANLPDLQGCLTDVELQRDLLINRFGFLPGDILTLTGAQATREGIETAFLEHFTQQSRAGDVVLFHFSGYGGRVQMEREGETSSLRLGLIPSDGLLPTKVQPVLNSLSEVTLELLVRSLTGDRATLVLDTSCAPPQQSLEGNLRGRSLSLKPGFSTPEELAFQADLQHRLSGAGNSSKNMTLLRAAKIDQIATEIAMDGEVCGLFTYALTQALWEMTPAQRIYTTLARTAEQMAPLRGDRQQLDLTQSGQLPLFIYGLLPETTTSADGIILNAPDPTTLSLKLIGLPRSVLLSYGDHSCLSMVGDRPVPLEVQLRSRRGFNAQAQILPPIPDFLPAPGRLLQETLRVLPRQLRLIVALDPKLERIERVDATSALSGLNTITSITTLGDSSVDCILSKIPVPNSVPPSENSPSLPFESGYGLRGEGGIVLANSVGKPTEAIKSAVGRLEPQWNQLMALKILNLIQNENSTRLAVKATLELIHSPPQSLVSKASQRSSLDRNALTSEAVTSTLPPTFLPQIPLGSRLQLRVENHETFPLYLILLIVDPSSKAIAYLPALDEDEPIPWTMMAADTTLLIPPDLDSLPWSSSKRSGLAQLFVIFTRQPCAHFLESLAQTEGNDLKILKDPFLRLSNPSAIAQALLDDLHDMSHADPTRYDLASDHYALDLQVWATLHFLYQAV